VVVGFIGAMGGMMIALNVMFQVGLGFSPLACGLATVVIPVAAIGGSITSSMLLARIGRTTMQIGIVVMASGLVIADLVMRSASGGLTAWELAGPLAITGYAGRSLTRCGPRGGACGWRRPTAAAGRRRPSAGCCRSISVWASRADAQNRHVLEWPGPHGRSNVDATTRRVVAAAPCRQAA